METRPIRVVIADDHQMILEGSKNFLSQQPGMEVVGTASNGVAALTITINTQPDVLVLDINMPGKSGEEVAKEVLSVLPNTKIIIVTGLEDVNIFKRLREIGVSGYLLKEEKLQDLDLAIRTVHDGGTHWGHAIAKKVMDELIPPKDQPKTAQLTPKEKEVLALVCKFGTAGEMAHLLGVAESTVQTHLKAMYAKLRLRNRQALNEYARVNGYCGNQNP